MDDYAGRVLADRYRLPVPPADAYDVVETRAFDTYSGQEVRIRQVPLPEVVDAELVGDEPYRAPGGATRRPADPGVRRALEAAQAAAQIPDHPRLDQVFDVFAEAGSLWIVSEFVAATPLSELLAEAPLSPYRAAEIGNDLLTALRALHAHGWTHRNLTPRTVLVCDDGRVVLTGLAAGAAEEALCGYAPVPLPDDEAPLYGSHSQEPDPYEADPYEADAYEADAYEADAYEADSYESAEHDPELYEPGAYEPEPGDPGEDGAELYEPEAYEPGEDGAEVYPAGADVLGGRAPALPVTDADEAGDGSASHDTDTAVEDEPDGFYGPDADTPYGSGRTGGGAGLPELPGGSGAPATPPAADVRAARAGAIAAYRAGARAAARLGETGALPVQRPAPPTPPPPPAHPEPQWWSQAEDDEDDVDDEDETGGTYGTPPPRAYLAGTWSDGPHAARDGSRSVPAGGGGQGPVLPVPALPAGYTPATPAPLPVPAGAAAPPDAGDVYRGPATRLAAERARQARIAVVGAVTERWAPEQAGPVHEHWRLAPPIGPATDLWALGALLYRAVQGHAPYPEDNAAELVQLVCAEPPAFAEECGPLRPVVESLLRQDPTERPDVEELSGWLRSLVRSAPEPEAGIGVVPLPSPDATRLPVVRRRGELVRRWRGGAAGGRHRHAKGGRVPRQARRQDPPEYRPEAQAEFTTDPRTGHQSGHQADYQAGGRADYRADYQAGRRAGHQDDRRAGHRADYQAEFREEIPQRASRAPAARRTPGSPRSLGRMLLILTLLLLAGAVAYALLFMPEQGGADGPSANPTPTQAQPPAKTTAPSVQPPPTKSSRPPTTGQPPATTPSTPALAAGYELRKDPEGFQVGVPRGWRRSPINDAGQVRFTSGDFTLVVVPGRDTVQANGADPMAYQRTKERELQPWRDSSWSSASGLRRIDVGRQAMAVGQFTWQDSTGREVFVRNLALIEGGHYHVVQVIGPENERDKVSEIYDQAVKVYRSTR
ncbi:protein kinase [Streptomyces sp. NPDC085481]|uniref:protein kinase n=1 Tax=Streptomyces sp. NPDC085481 TaxID=3365727 RepID=UPI0037D82E89